MLNKKISFFIFIDLFLDGGFEEKFNDKIIRLSPGKINIKSKKVPNRLLCS